MASTILISHATRCNGQRGTICTLETTLMLGFLRIVRRDRWDTIESGGFSGSVSMPQLIRRVSRSDPCSFRCPVPVSGFATFSTQLATSGVRLWIPLIYIVRHRVLMDTEPQQVLPWPKLANQSYTGRAILIYYMVLACHPAEVLDTNATIGCKAFALSGVMPHSLPGTGACHASPINVAHVFGYDHTEETVAVWNHAFLYNL